MPHSFASVILVDERGWVLMQERDEHPVIDPERWGLPGGHLEPGEDPEVAAYRELVEETGVRMEPGRLRRWGEVQVHHEAYDSLDTVTVYVARTGITDAEVVCHEGRQMVFVDPTVAPTLDLTASAALVVPAFLGSSLYAELRPVAPPRT